MKSLPILAPLAFLVTASIGWILAGNPVLSAPSTGEMAVATRATHSERPTRKVRGPDGIAGQRLAAIRASRDPAARMRATVDLARTLPPAEFAEWLGGDWFNVRDGAELTLFTKIIAERWTLQDPEGFALWALKNNPQRANDLFNSWVAINPQQALDFFRDHPNDKYEYELLSKVAIKDPALALRRFQELAASVNSADSVMGRDPLLKVLAETDPTGLQSALESMPDSWRKKAEAALIVEKMKGSPEEGFQNLLERDDGAELWSGLLRTMNPSDTQAIREKILSNLADLPDSWRAMIASSPYGFISNISAEKWLTTDLEASGFTAEQAKTVRSRALNYFFNQPELALKCLPEVEMDDANRKSFIKNLFNRLRDNPEKAESLRALLTTDEDRQIASDAISPEGDTSQDAIKTPAAWLDGLAKLGSADSAYRFASVAEQWDKDQSAELTRQFQALPVESRRSIAANLTKNDYGQGFGPLGAEAVRFLITDGPQTASDDNDPRTQDSPLNKNIALASEYIRKLADTDPAAASDWIRSLPDGQPKLWSEMNLHTLWSQYDPAAANEWLGSLPAANRAAVLKLAKEQR